ncbi:MAG: hypothetical protein WBW37_05190, partial [Methyloceanibacter sp.]
ADERCGSAIAMCFRVAPQKDGPAGTATFGVLATNIQSVVPVSNPIALHHQLGIVRQPFNHQNATLET